MGCVTDRNLGCYEPNNSSRYTPTAKLRGFRFAYTINRRTQPHHISHEYNHVTPLASIWFVNIFQLSRFYEYYCAKVLPMYSGHTRQITATLLCCVWNGEYSMSGGCLQHVDMHAQYKTIYLTNCWKQTETLGTIIAE
jgi:hypothetical protein